jgi:hypothetical protein
MQVYVCTRCGWEGSEPDHTVCGDGEDITFATSLIASCPLCGCVVYPEDVCSNCGEVDPPPWHDCRRGG